MSKKSKRKNNKAGQINKKDRQVNKSEINVQVKEASSVERTIPASGKTMDEEHNAVLSKKPTAQSHVSDGQHIVHPTISYVYTLVLFALLIVVFILKLKADSDLKNANALNDQLKAAVITASENIAQLSAENAEQKKQLEALSLALNARTEMAESQKKEEEVLSIPELYPVKGDAIVVSAPENASETTPEADNLLRFSMYEGSYAVATGNGVIEILSDGGDGLLNIIVDHGNGYKSSYTGEGIALKEAGDEIKQGDALMIFTGDGLDFTYSLSLDGKTVDPVSMMNIDG